MLTAPLSAWSRKATSIASMQSAIGISFATSSSLNTSVMSGSEREAQRLGNVPLLVV